MTADSHPLSRTKVFKALRTLLDEKIDPDEDPGDFFYGESTAFYGDSTGYEDRSVALVAHTNLELALETAISSYFVSLEPDEYRNLFSEDSDSPLASFASKTRFGYALGIFSGQIRNDLVCINRIRNAFAHARYHLDFETDEIVNACKILRLPISGIWPDHHPRPHDAKDLFIDTAFRYALALYATDEVRNKTVSEAEFYPDAPIPSPDKSL